MKKITKRDAIRGLKVAVKERGDEYVHVDRCQYVDLDGVPACGVGLALSKLGFDFAEVLRAGDNEHCITAVSAITSKCTVGAIKVFELFQNSQDRGHPWGATLEATLTLDEPLPYIR